MVSGVCSVRERSNWRTYGELDPGVGRNVVGAVLAVLGSHLAGGDSFAGSEVLPVCLRRREDDRLGLENHQRCFPPWQGFPQHYPETAIRSAELRPWRLPFEDHDLVPQGQNLQGELVLGMEQGQRVAQERESKSEHVRSTWGQIHQNQRLISETDSLPPTGIHHFESWGTFSPETVRPEALLCHDARISRLRALCAVFRSENE